MRTLTSCVCVLVLIVEAGGQTKVDDYSIPIVQKILVERRRGFSTGTSEKLLERLGDRAAVALVKIISEEETKDPGLLRAVILPLLLDAFAAPDVIAQAEDRHPKVTILLLHKIRCDTHDSDLKEQIEGTINSIERLTKPFR